MQDVLPPPSRALTAFALFYGGMVCMAGVLGNKLIAIGPLAVEAGIFAFLLLVVTSSAIAELWGRQVANRTVLVGFVPMIVSMLLIQLVLRLPASPEMPPERLAAFEAILGQSARLMLAGLIAYGTSTILNVTIFTAMKGREGARPLWLRAAVASVVSQLVDTMLFITIAFYGVFPIGPILVGQAITKMILSALVVPALIYLWVWIGRRLDAPDV
ncbi:MAG: queuosine precursor transporter [Parafilimonas terrae]|nr:queuosine precursor transporter [Parafilimonas terrae]